MRIIIPTLVLLASLLNVDCLGSERLTGIACRSVHLQYPAPEAALFYTEMTVTDSAPGSYFMACGFNGGYFGIQQKADDSKVVLFSVWEPGGQNDPDVTPEDRRVKTLSQGEGVTVKRFGGEGTGGQSFYDYDWKIGETCRFTVTARLDGERTVYTGYIYLPQEQRWQQMAEFSTLNGGKLIRGDYSFVEDFRRNRESTKHLRKARFGNGWVRTPEGDWRALSKARFTADGNKATNIDAGTVNGQFYLETGGDSKNDGTPLWETTQLEDQPGEPPTELPKLQVGKED